MQSECIFCNIIHHVLPATVVAENDHVIAIKDIAPKAPVHYLIIPKKHLGDIRNADVCDEKVLSALLLMAKDLSSKLSSPTAFRLVFNNGYEVGQRVFHMHAHFLAGNQYIDL